MERVKGIEPSSRNAEPVANQSLPQVGQDSATQIDARIRDASCPDLAYVVAAWPNLPPPLKAAILAIVATNDKQKEALS
jgi:hypothetical protein